MDLSLKLLASGALLLFTGLFTCIANNDESEKVGLVGRIMFTSGVISAMIGAIWWIWTR